MIKKNNSTFFNLFEAEHFDDNEETALDATETPSEKKSPYVSIAQMEEFGKSEAFEGDAAQTTMFESESFNILFSEEKNKDTFFEETDEKLKKNTEPDEIYSTENFEDKSDGTEIAKGTIQDFEDVEMIEESEEIEEISTDLLEAEAFQTDDSDNSSNEFFVDPIASNAENDIQESEEQTNNISSENVQNISEIDINEDITIPSYDEIKSKSTQDSFEAPYTYHGKNGDRIRYRLVVPTENKPKRNRFRRSAMSWFLTILVAFILAMLLRTFVFVIATVDGPSMLPTLENNEKLFVTKFTYTFSEIERGDVVICKYGTEIYPDNYVKRVIGLGGEMISIKDGFVYINGTKLEEDYILEPMLSDMEPVYIPEDCVFVMGDNRNNSADSRKDIVGPIKKDLIIGKAQFIIAPFDKIGSLEAKK